MIRRAQPAQPLESGPRWRMDRHGVLIGDRIARFRDPSHRFRPLPPFPALLSEPVPGGAAPADFPVRVRFTDRAGRHVAWIETQPGTSLYGTGEAAGPLERTGRRTTVWTTDCFGYDGRTQAMYQAHPWVLAVRRDGSAFGVMVETTWPARIDLRRGILFECDGHSPAVIVIDRPDPQGVVRALAELTGHMPMPPRWALGYQQCRWSYEPESKVRQIAREFRERKIPCDVIWFDIDYMDGFRCFTFDKEKFPDPARLNHELHTQGFKAVCMIDPGIKADPDYSVYAQGRAGDHFVKTAKGEDYQGRVWPGQCMFPDFMRAETRQWWAGLYKDFMARNIDGVWNDMNEPAVFDAPGKTMSEDNVHRPDPALSGADPHANPHSPLPTPHSPPLAPHARYHNLYGMQMVRASREGIQAAHPEKRPFVLTRSNFLGGHRYAATWTGDNSSTWDHLRWSIPMALNLGLSGQPFVGPDIGGFVGNATPELFGRWMGIGALLPFARGHSVKDSKDHEPWSFGSECERVCRLALERRYRLLPYLYTLFWEASRAGAGGGLPIVRPLFFADPRDLALRLVDDAFLLGADVLVRADIHKAGTTHPSSLPVPRGTWTRFEPETEPCLDLPRLYLREGAIIPMGPVVQFTGERPLDPLTLVVSLDASGTASGTLYEDAGDGYGYQTGDFTLTEYHARREQGLVVVNIRHTEGSRARPEREVEVLLLSEDQIRAGHGRDGEDVVVAC